MPLGLQRFQEEHELHFITFSCRHRLPLLAQAEGYSVFERVLEETRKSHEFRVMGYVLMPEHVHLLISEPNHMMLAKSLMVLKQKSSRLLRGDREAFWERRYYDFNVFSEKKQTEKLRYMHRNPVARGLVTRPEEWPWSSYNHFLNGRTGTIEIDSWWTEQIRKRDVGHNS